MSPAFIDKEKQTCISKEVYNKKSAIGAAVRASKRFGIPLTFYKCHICKKFHLTKSANYRGNQWDQNTTSKTHIAAPL